MGDAHPDRADSNGVDRASTDRLLNACEAIDGRLARTADEAERQAAARLCSDAARGLAALIQPTDLKIGDRVLCRVDGPSESSGRVNEDWVSGVVENHADGVFWIQADVGAGFLVRCAGDLRKPEPVVRDYAKERALIDAKHLLAGLAPEDVECLGLGRITARALRLASRKVGVRIIDCEYLDDVNVAEMLSDMLAAGRLLLEASR